jgi:hypothetical protein
MRIGRRELLVGAGAAALAGKAAAQAQSSPPGPSRPNPSRNERIAAVAGEHRHRLDLANGAFSGSAWDWLLARGREAHFFLIGEQHGIAENPKLAGALFRALAPSGYAHAAIEISPPMAAEYDRVLRAGGLSALRRFYAEPGNQAAFFGMREEAEWLAAAVAADPGNRPVLWGMDYEVGADRHLIRMLRAKPKPAAATAALIALETASNASWAHYAETHNPQFMYSFAGDPALVERLRAAWPRADAEARWIMDVLQGTFEINLLWTQNRGWESNARRAQLMRANFLAYWRAEKAAGRSPRLMMKMGSYHLMRGLSGTDVYDLGTLVPELAALEGAKAFQLLVLNGPGTETAQFDPTAFVYRSAAESEMHDTLAPLIGRSFDHGFTLFETAPLRGIARLGAEGVDSDLARAIHGFDAILILTGSTPSANL